MRFTCQRVAQFKQLQQRWKFLKHPQKQCKCCLNHEVSVCYKLHNVQNRMANLKKNMTLFRLVWFSKLLMEGILPVCNLQDFKWLETRRNFLCMKIYPVGKLCTRGGGACVNMRERLTGRNNVERDKKKKKKRTVRLHPTWWSGPPDPQASSSLMTEQGHIAPPYNPGSLSHERSLCANT